MNKIQVLEERIRFLYKNNVVRKWVCNLDKAHLFIAYVNLRDTQASILESSVTQVIIKFAL